MDLEDLLENFKMNPDCSLHEYLDREFHLTTGKKLYYQMLDYFKSNKIMTRNWYFSKNSNLRNERPYDFCRTGKVEEVEKLLE
jgi:hypothetical protein